MAATAHGTLLRMVPRPERRAQLLAHLTAWHRGPGRMLPGTRLHILLDQPDGGTVTALHLFETEAVYTRAIADAAHQAWQAALVELLREPPVAEHVTVAWNAAVDARPRLSVSIDRDVHATVQDLVGRLLDRHPRTAAEDLYLSLLQSIAADYEAEFPATAPEEGEPR